MDWTVRLNAVIAYIEQNLADSEISYHEIGRLAGCSAYNFQRMFAYVAGKTVGEYIRSRKLTLAAFDLLHTNDKVIDLGLKYGYESHDAFTRAFKGFHGVTPSMVRAQTVSLQSCPKLHFTAAIKGVNPVQYQIEQRPAFTVAGYKHQIKTEESTQTIPPLWTEVFQTEAKKRLFAMLDQAQGRPGGLLGVCADNPMGNDAVFDYYIAVTIGVDGEIPSLREIDAKMSTLEVPAATWAVFTANGKLPEAVQEVITRFYAEWLPNSGYELENLPMIESYLGDERQEVWVAVKTK